MSWLLDWAKEYWWSFLVRAMSLDHGSLPTASKLPALVDRVRR
ncbi:hypothetical protein [Nocardia sp. NPDC059691]